MRNVYCLVTASDIIQHHDALEDAKMLCEVVNNIKNVDVQHSKEKLATMKSTRIRPKQNPAPEIYRSWDGIPKNQKYQANTNASADNYKVCAFEHAHPETKIYFDSLNTAALWVIKFATGGMSPKKLEDIQRVEKNILNGFNKGKNSYAHTWEIKE